jgi:2-oxo-4-hydroxy-4-carboxy--5-ureidoimidazoline (OHCU) decarboxylase
MERRLAQDPDREHEAAISEAVRIASGRLTDIIGNR